jgi:hypothetical protein
MFELFCLDSEFPWDGTQEWVPIRAEEEFFGWPVEVSLKSTKVFLNPADGSLGGGVGI